MSLKYCLIHAAANLASFLQRASIRKARVHTLSTGCGEKNDAKLTAVCISSLDLLKAYMGSGLFIPLWYGMANTIMGEMQLSNLRIKSRENQTGKKPQQHGFFTNNWSLEKVGTGSV